VASRIRSRRRAGSAARRGSKTSRSSPASVRPRDCGLPARLRRARVAALARHEHAAQDLSVPAVRQADRRHPAADPHQVLGDETAILTGATPREFADGIIAALQDPARRAVGARARALAETKYSYAAYLDRTRQACAALLPSPAAVAVAKDVA
jgi:hypothetical protein